MPPLDERALLLGPEEDERRGLGEALDDESQTDADEEERNELWEARHSQFISALRYGGTVARMGDEARATLTYQGRVANGRAKLETDELVFRGDVRLRVPLRSVSAVEAEGDRLLLSWDGEHATLDLGEKAARWAERIRNPKTLADKLGVKPGQAVAVVGDVGPEGDLFPERVEPGEAHTIFLGADLEQVGYLAGLLTGDGALWIVAPKGGVEPREAQVIEAGRTAGLKDVKVVRWSDTHTAHKFVIPVEDR